MPPVVISGVLDQPVTAKIAPCRLVLAVLLECASLNLTHPCACPPVVSSKARVPTARQIRVRCHQPLARAASPMVLVLWRPRATAGSTAASTPETTRHAPRTLALNLQRLGHVAQRMDRAVSKPRPTVKVQAVRTAVTAPLVRPTPAHSLQVRGPVACQPASVCN